MDRSDTKLVKLFVMVISILSKRHLLYGCGTATEKSIINTAESWKAIHSLQVQDNVSDTEGCQTVRKPPP